MLYSHVKDFCFGDKITVKKQSLNIKYTLNKTVPCLTKPSNNNGSRLSIESACQY